MEIKKWVLQVEEYASPAELTEEDRTLLEKAVIARASAYAPYSHFEVGAAVRLVNGRIFTGNNQENVAYPSGLCAERVALFQSQAECPDVPVEAIAITAAAEEFAMTEPVSPCGSCRQVMAEYENRHRNRIRVIMAGNGYIRAVNGIENLLPFMFMLEGLKKPGGRRAKG
jgi:cytidine deaminase